MLPQFFFGMLVAPKDVGMRIGPTNGYLVMATTGMNNIMVNMVIF
jgi:hypothetical protein